MARAWMLAAVLCLVNCGGAGGGGAAPEVIATADLSANRLQFSIGTANIATNNLNGDQFTGPSVNLVETFRQPSGATGLLDSAVSMTGPPTFVAENLYSNSGIPFDGGAANQVLDQLQGFIAGGEGLAQLVDGVAAAPLIGGPPAFPRTTDGNYPAGFSYGIAVMTIGGNAQFFPHGFPLGTYTLSVTTPKGSGQSASWTAAARLATMTTLPPLASPFISFDGKGGGAVSLVVPPKLTELFVGISAGNELCWPQATLTQDQTGLNTSGGLFSFFIKRPVPGPLVIAIPDSLGPPAGTGNAPTFCSMAQNVKANVGGDVAATTGADAAVSLLGADYPLYEMSYPQSSMQTPPIAGAADPDGKPLPQSDVSISAVTNGTAP